MEWTGEGLLISTRRHGESSVIAEAMVVGRGRCLGLVRGGRSTRLSPVLQPGNTIQLTWRARLEDQLGLFIIELLQARANAKETDLALRTQDHFAFAENPLEKIRVSGMHLVGIPVV